MGLYNDTLILILARGGSKRLPGKNIKLLDGKPLITYSIDYARKFVPDENICISTDSAEIAKVAEDVGLRVPFLRPHEYAGDASSSEEAMIHAAEHYDRKGIKFKNLVLLQPTSPFRKEEHLLDAFDLLKDEVEAVVSVSALRKDFTSVYVYENKEKILEKVHSTEVSKENPAKIIYEINGSIYLMRMDKFLEYRSIPKFEKVKKIVQSNYYSADIDTIEDWKYCEFIIDNKLLD